MGHCEPLPLVPRSRPTRNVATSPPCNGVTERGASGGGRGGGMLRGIPTLCVDRSVATAGHGGRRFGCCGRSARGGLATSACASSSLSEGTRRVCHVGAHVLGGLGFHAGILKEAEVSGPVDEAKLPGSERDAFAVGQSAEHAAAVRQGVAGVA